MSYEIKGFCVGTETAAADLSSSQFLFANFSATGVAIASGAGAPADGILQDSPGSGESASVMTDGVSKVIASAAILKGAEVATTAAGKAATAVSTNNILGTALEAAGADGDIIAVLISKQGIKA